MGTIHIEDGVPYGQGTEIGAFVRLDDLDPGTPYRDMDRAVIMGPENPNARMVVPASPYRVSYTIIRSIYLRMPITIQMNMA